MDRLEDYLERMTSQESELLQDLAEQTVKKLSAPQMMSSRISGRFLKQLASLMGARHALEIGMFSGYASLSIAEGLQEEGQLYCCELDESVIEFAKGFFAKSPFGHKITVYQGYASQTLEQVPSDLDLVFIDADKQNYPLYYEMSLAKLRKGGVIVVDNALWNGQVLDPKSEDDWAIAHLNDLIVRDERVENVLLPIRDGMNVVRKKF